jgi:hypothetical protein
MNARLFIRVASAAALVLAGNAARGADPVALVEDAANAPGVGFMDYLEQGRVIELGTGGTLVVDYLGSCVRETIAGGRVTIGTEGSTVAGGKVRSETVQCDGGKLQLTTQQANQGGVVVFRGPPVPPPGRPRVATLYGLSPLFDLGAGGHLVVERIDRRGERIVVNIGPSQLVNGIFYDFAKSGRGLAPGGVYRASMDGRSVVFRIDPGAEPGLSPVAGRLLRL